MLLELLNEVWIGCDQAVFLSAFFPCLRVNLALIIKGEKIRHSGPVTKELRYYFVFELLKIAGYIIRQTIGIRENGAI